MDTLYPDDHGHGVNGWPSRHAYADYFTVATESLIAFPWSRPTVLDTKLESHGGPESPESPRAEIEPYDSRATTLNQTATLALAQYCDMPRKNMTDIFNYRAPKHEPHLRRSQTKLMIISVVGGWLFPAPEEIPAADMDVPGAITCYIPAFFGSFCGDCLINCGEFNRNTPDVQDGEQFLEPGLAEIERLMYARQNTIASGPERWFNVHEDSELLSSARGGIASPSTVIRRSGFAVSGRHISSGPLAWLEAVKQSSQNRSLSSQAKPCISALKRLWLWFEGCVFRGSTYSTVRVKESIEAVAGPSQAVAGALASRILGQSWWLASQSRGSQAKPSQRTTTVTYVEAYRVNLGQYCGFITSTTGVFGGKTKRELRGTWKTPMAMHWKVGGMTGRIFRQLKVYCVDAGLASFTDPPHRQIEGVKCGIEASKGRRQDASRDTPWSALEILNHRSHPSLAIPSCPVWCTGNIGAFQKRGNVDRTSPGFERKRRPH
ncbi:hypothetical protein B0H14DRAFT_2572182 [Mycena olivaceomarginata]|nr:hypothetical protein B0H14DRAFT_2572182 [Mycena olivaceomarginata]